MNSRDICRAAYQSYIATAEMPEDLRRSLKTHERVPAFIDNLAMHVERIEKSPKLKARTRLNIEKITSLAIDFTKVFVANVIRQADERRMSDAEKQRILKAQSDAKELDKLVEETITHEQIRTDSAGNETQASTHEI